MRIPVQIKTRSTVDMNNRLMIEYVFQEIQ